MEAAKNKKKVKHASMMFKPETSTDGKRLRAKSGIALERANTPYGRQLFRLAHVSSVEYVIWNTVGSFKTVFHMTDIPEVITGKHVKFYIHE
ncbi:hypothetical protein PM082_018567 [Marasmius tenuissimus]|nr:hypothetical protein PM082_018567 [Marasmius tenuissimus]